MLCVQVEFFEPFWDSGEARVGELGARGWKAWMLQQERGGWLQPSAGTENTPRHCYSKVCCPKSETEMSQWKESQWKPVTDCAYVFVSSQRKKRMRKRTRRRLRIGASPDIQSGWMWSHLGKQLTGCLGGLTNLRANQKRTVRTQTDRYELKVSLLMCCMFRSVKSTLCLYSDTK